MNKIEKWKDIKYKEGYEYGLIPLKILESGELSRLTNTMLKRAIRKGWNLVESPPHFRKDEINMTPICRPIHYEEE